MAFDSLFSKRAVERFNAAVSSGSLGPKHVGAVLKYDSVDISSIEPLIDHENEWVRRCVAKIIVEKGNNERLIQRALIEEDKAVLLEILQLVFKCKDGLEKLVFLLDSEDKAIKHSAIQMFRRAGRSDCLFSLVFSKDDKLVDKIKEYIEEHDSKA